MESLGRQEIGRVLDLVAGDLGRIEELIVEASGAASEFLTEAAAHLTQAGGKRLRPALVVLSSLIDGDERERRKVDLIAAAVEMTHLATLYHDDVIDEADLRRGVPSANEKWGNKVAILAGDYLFARASHLASQVGGEVSGILADAVAGVVRGQLDELEAAYDPGRSRDRYLQTIEGKTASLMQAATRIGAMLAGCRPEVISSMENFGREFGLAFQVADDLLDLAASEEELGKPPGTDLRDGVYTLPVITAIEADETVRDLLVGPGVNIEAVLRAVVETGAYGRSLEVAEEFAARARAELEGVAESPARSALAELLDLMVARVPRFLQ